MTPDLAPVKLVQQPVMLLSRLSWLRRQLNLESMLMLVLRSRRRRSSILTRLDLDLWLSLRLRVSVNSLGLHLLARHLHVGMRRWTRRMRGELLMHLHLRH